MTILYYFGCIVYLLACLKATLYFISVVDDDPEINGPIRVWHAILAALLALSYGTLKGLIVGLASAVTVVCFVVYGIVVISKRKDGFFLNRPLSSFFKGKATNTGPR